jgi:glycosyltransferase involved in cell wall biosynthesis
MSTKHLVVSAVNLVEAGTLEILKQCLAEASQLNGWRVTAIVHDAKLVDVLGVCYLERKEIKGSWLRRIYFEYVECKRIEAELQPDYWLSLHDMSPSLRTTPQGVYCHNAMCFYRFSLSEVIKDFKLYMFSKIYELIYKININKNRTVIVQQQWIRQEFFKRFGCKNVLVAHPNNDDVEVDISAIKRKGWRFFYPAVPRFYKNFEVILEAWKSLCENPDWDGELVVTVNELSGSYGRGLLKRFGGLKGVNFAGRLTRSQVQQMYLQSDCLIFPSKLETWGLPITEAKHVGLAILVADRLYAREAVGNYAGVEFFPVDDSAALASLMLKFRRGTLDFRACENILIGEPYAANWRSLFYQILPN